MILLNAMIYIGADHRGFELKGKICKWLFSRGYEFEDLGAYEYDPGDDYVDFAEMVSRKVAATSGRGILMCGSGVGVSVAANKVKGVRCGLGFEADQVHAARKDDDINVLAVASDNTSAEKAFSLVEQFLTTTYVQSDKHSRRIEKVSRMENE
jgi:ribose 5-phosphate isomerase B